MKNRSTTFVLFTISFFFFSCKDFIEKDIHKKTVVLLSPADGFVTYSLTQTFWWEEVDGAEQYTLEIVKPDFSSVQQLILDTLITKNKFGFTFLSPGNYQWRVRAINNGSETEYSVRSLKIDSTLDLSTQIVLLISPVDNFSTRDTSITFKWSSLYNATQYNFRLYDSTGTSLFFDTLTSNNILHLILSEGTYKWQVRAENNNSTSPYSFRNLTLDFTSPSAPIQNSPAFGDTSSTPVILNWRHDQTSVGDSVYIFNDSLLSNLSTSVFSTDTTYSFNALTSRFYYWKIRSVDAVGNKSSYSNISKFYVQ